ncbi:hypothetical protein KY284_030147 [Solanum tuberosum]|nr:hypothetical protein KY284_030147 [Solanum tuberosum]
MSRFNSLSFILNQNKLEGPNYVDWKRNIDIVITSEGFKYVLVEERPIRPADATDEEIKAYEKCVKADEMARCCSLASISNVLQHQLMSMTSAYDILESLKGMFREKNHASK